MTYFPEAGVYHKLTFPPIAVNHNFWEKGTAPVVPIVKANPLDKDVRRRYLICVGGGSAMPGLTMRAQILLSPEQNGNWLRDGSDDLSI